MSPTIASTAVVDAGAELADDVTVGPYCVVAAGARLGPGVTLQSHVVVRSGVEIGARTRVHAFACLGDPGQLRKPIEDGGRVAVGADGVIREHVTIHAGALGDDRCTQIGDRCLLMVGAHVGHDCRLGEEVTLTNNALLGGHVELGDHVMIGGQSAVHQFCRIGAGAFVAGMAGVWADVAPNAFAIGDRARLEGLNVVGLKRRGWTGARIRHLRRIHAFLFNGDGTFADRAAMLMDVFPGDEDASVLADFIGAEGNRPMLQPLKRRSPKA